MGWEGLSVWKRRVICVRGRGLLFLHKNKLKSQIFNDKKSLETKMFLTNITKNLN